MTRLCFALALFASPALAQPNCLPHDVMLELLADSYGESRQVIALASSGALVEIFASLDTQTWTITVTEPGGPTCMVASGTHYETPRESLPPQGDDL